MFSNFQTFFFISRGPLTGGHFKIDSSDPNIKIVTCLPHFLYPIDIWWLLRTVCEDFSIVSGALFCCVVLRSMRSGVPRNLVRGRVQEIQLKTEDRENGDLGAVAP